tara:strand:+ start:82 stop:330 length:249 start_codon:yes stop_codon:yes gene_type:complete
MFLLFSFLFPLCTSILGIYRGDISIFLLGLCSFLAIVFSARDETPSPPDPSGDPPEDDPLFVEESELDELHRLLEAKDKGVL